MFSMLNALFRRLIRVINKILKMIHNSFLHDLFIMFVLLFTIYFLDGILDNSYMYDLFLYYFGVVDQDINDMSYNDLFHVLVQTLLLLIFIVAVNFLNVYGI